MPKKKEMPKPRKMSIADAVSEAIGEIQSLAEEMREAYDNTPESLQSSGVGEARGEAADNLEQIDEPDVPEEVKDFNVEITDLPPKRRGHSRRERRDQATYILEVCIDALNERIDMPDEKEAIKEAAESCRDELETAKDNAECVEFPGMFG
jgi:hypothetical protein